jgi:hypothetical protein
VAQTPEQRRAWYQKNKERQQARSKTYREKNREKVREYARKWRSENLDRAREYSRAYGDKNSGKRRAWAKENPEKVREHSLKYREKYPEKDLLNRARARAKARGIEFSIAVEDVVIPERCPIFGVLLRRGSRTDFENAPTLDRIDSSKGYVPGNVWVIGHRANAIKNDGTPEEHEQIAAAVRKRLQEK